MQQRAQFPGKGLTVAQAQGLSKTYPSNHMNATMGNQYKHLALITCMKSVLFAFNFVFWVTGICILIVGLWAEFDLYQYMNLSPDFTGAAPHVIIGISTLMVITSSVAFSCIVKGQPVLLFIYGSFMLCIFMMEVGLSASVVCFRDGFAQGLYEGLTETLKNYDPVKTNFDFAQSAMQCCGVSNYTDWIWFSPQRVIPTSCCINTTHCVTANYNDVYQRGCYAVIYMNIKDNMDLIIAIAIATSVLPLAGAAMSCCLGNYIRRTKYDAIG
ncbi:tetraspanin-7-like [Pieris brassicae]|uniref:Tetraspanin n=1 Tax=Pieris brassicae TaxID=7116 RepID=A0A9P0X4Z4_PIEBR|nr:tetraspanin-7-like [Pieris brassicae]CAH4006357.1 unnamed protein product [Pieris brassicae]